MPQSGTRRRAVRIATAVAVPVALLTGVGVYTLAGGFDQPAATRPAPGSATVPVQMPAPSLGAREATLCRTLIEKLPVKVRDLNRRPVSAGTDQNAAYGEPALTLACAG